MLLARLFKQGVWTGALWAVFRHARSQR